MPLRNLLYCLPFLLGASLMAQSLSGPGRIYGVGDTDIPTPQHSTKTTSDSAALQSVIDFVRMSGVSGWQGFSATGAMTFAGSTDTNQATLTILGSDRYRLDVQKAAGQESTVFKGSFGVFKPASGKQISISSDIATLGLLEFPRLLSSDYPLAATVISDQGNVSIAGQSLHRITLDDPATDGTGNRWKTIDLYFDPSTKQLVESVAFVHLSTADAALYTIETKYEDYRTVGLATLPYRYTQSLNGNRQWTLQLDTVDMSSVPPPSLFSF